MSIKRITAIEAASHFESNSQALYVDVRTVAEFASGHPKVRCVNVPILFRYPDNNRTIGNDAFTLVIRYTVDNSDLVIVGSEQHQRAQEAVETLTNSGIGEVMLMKGGYQGWIKAGMATTRDNRDGVSYVSLLTAARREKK